MLGTPCAYFRRGVFSFPQFIGTPFVYLAEREVFSTKEFIGTSFALLRTLYGIFLKTSSRIKIFLIFTYVVLLEPDLHFRNHQEKYSVPKLLQQQ